MRRCRLIPGSLALPLPDIKLVICYKTVRLARSRKKAQYITDEAQLWKFDGTTLVNKKSTSTIKGEWKFVPEGETFCIENTENNKVLSLASDSGDEIEVKEMFRSNDLRQFWKIGIPNEEGYFNIIEALSSKALTGEGDGLKIDGRLIS